MAIQDHFLRFSKTENFLLISCEVNSFLTGRTPLHLKKPSSGKKSNVLDISPSMKTLLIF